MKGQWPKCFIIAPEYERYKPSLEFIFQKGACWALNIIIYRFSTAFNILHDARVLWSLSHPTLVLVLWHLDPHKMDFPIVTGIVFKAMKGLGRVSEIRLQLIFLFRSWRFVLGCGSPWCNFTHVLTMTTSCVRRLWFRSQKRCSGSSNMLSS